MKEKTFEELIDETEAEIFLDGHKYYSDYEIKILMQQVREATKREAVNINDEVILFNMGVDLESDVEFRDANAEILNLPTDRIRLTENK